MEISTLLIALGCGFVALNIVYSLLIVNELKKREVKINYLLIRLYTIKYARQYKQLTKEETGRPGWFYYAWVVTINIALVLVVMGLIIKAL